MNDTDKKIALVIASLSSFLTPFMGSATNVALPTIGKEFSLNAILLSWVATAYILTAAIFLIPFGKVADLYGRKRIFRYGIIIFTGSSLLAALAGNAFTLIACQVIQGIGSAMIFGTSIAIVTSVYPVGERGKVLGINVAAVYLGLSLGPFLGGLLTEHLGWRSIFLFNFPIGSLIILLTIWKLKGEWHGEREKFDLIGSVVYGLALVALMLGFSQLPRGPGVRLLLAGIFMILIFIRLEVKAASPLLDMRLFWHNMVFAFSNLAAVINYSATSAVGFLISLYLQYIKGMSPQVAGMVLMAQPVIMAAFSPLAGRLSDRIEPRIVASAGMGFSAVGLALLVFLNNNTSLSYIVAGLVVLGFGFALFSSPNTNAIMSSVEKRFYGVASATLGTMRLLGQMFSIGFAASLFSIYIGQAQITPENHHLFINSVRTAFIVFCILCFGGIFASLARGKLR